MTSLVGTGPLALYFGADKFDQGGHYLRDTSMRVIERNMHKITGLPWSTAIMDTCLLKNGQIHDEVTGRVYWTHGGTRVDWFAFFWWDRSADSRPNSNSGFYVRGFDYHQLEEAWRFACHCFPRVIERQTIPLTLVSR